MNALELRRRTLGKGVYKKTVEGNPAIAQGCLARRYLSITMQGWTEQAQYEGNQLFDASVFDGIERSGVRVSVDNGVITASGMSESAIWIRSADFTEEDFEKFKSGNIYVKNYKSSECNYEVGIYINDTTVKKGNSPYPIPDGYLETKPNNVYFFIDIRAGIELKGSCKPMIYQDGDGTWEPYTGGQPSPNPDYPQEIVSAGKYDEESQKYQYEVKLTGKNLFDPDGEIVDGSPYDGIPLNNNGIVSMALYEKNPDVDVSNIYFGICSEELNSNDVIWALASGTIQSGGKIISPMNNRYVCWYPGSDTVLQNVLSRYDVMVNYGDGVYLPYQPYKEQTVTLTSDRPLTKWDRLEKRDGVWGWMYKSDEIVLDGSAGESWSRYDTGVSGITIFNVFINDKKSGIENVLCDKMLNNSGFGAWTKKEPYYLSGHFNNKYCYLTVKDSDAVEIIELKQWLSEHPLTLLYETEEETFVPLSESEQEALNALHTFRPTTVLSNDCDCNMTLTYKTKKSLEVAT